MIQHLTSARYVGMGYLSVCFVWEIFDIIRTVFKSLHELLILISFCSQQFAWPMSYHTHMRKHSGKTNYFCRKCNQKFAMRRSLINHLKKPCSAANVNYTCKVRTNQLQVGPDLLQICYIATYPFRIDFRISESALCFRYAGQF